MVLQEGLPAPCRFRIFPCSAYPAGDSSLRNIEPKFQQLAVNARSTPSGILGDHAKNQLSQLFAYPLEVAACITGAKK